MNPVTAVPKLWHKSNTINTEQMIFVRNDALYCGTLGKFFTLFIGHEGP